MYKYKKVIRSLFGPILATTVVLASGCSSIQPYTVEHEAEGMKPGAGLLTGETGEKTIFSLPEGKSGQTEKPKAVDAS